APVVEADDPCDFSGHKPGRMLHRPHLRGPRQRGCVGARHAGTGRHTGQKYDTLLTVPDRAGLPVAVCPVLTTSHEVRLVAPTLNSRVVEDLPLRLVGERAYDADPLNAGPVQLGIERLAPGPTRATGSGPRPGMAAPSADGSADQ